MKTLNTMKYTKLMAKFYTNPLTLRLNCLLRANPVIQVDFTRKSSPTHKFGIAYKFDSLNKNRLSINHRVLLHYGKFYTQMGFFSPSKDRLLAAKAKAKFEIAEPQLLKSINIEVGCQSIFNRENKLKTSYLNLFTKLNLVKDIKCLFNLSVTDFKSAQTLIKLKKTVNENNSLVIETKSETDSQKFYMNLRHKYKIYDYCVIQNRVYSEYIIESSFKYKLNKSISMVYSSWVDVNKFFRYNQDFKVGIGLYIKD